MVTMTHPKLPGRTITVTEAAAAIHALSGWEIKSKPTVDAKPKEPTK